ncbi:MAG: HAD-IIIA family hydrolase [bacterium]
MQSKFDVVLLVGGLGTRLKSVVGDQAKCMASIADKPFLSYLLQYLSQFPELNRVFLAVCFAKEGIIEWIDENRESYPFEIDFVVEDKPLGTGGAIKKALEQINTQQVCVMNGDTYFDVNLSDYFTRHINGKYDISLALKKKYNFDRYGEVGLQGSTITQFKEKAPCAEGVINGGIYFINKNSTLLSVDKEKFSFETDILEQNVLCGSIGAYEYEGYFIDIGIPEDYARADKYFAFFPNFSIVNLQERDISKYQTLFLDRDGVINILRPNDYVKTVDEFIFMPGILELLALWSKHFKHIIVVTNQRGVGRGVMTEGALQEIHKKMVEEIEANDGRIDNILYCTATDESHQCRKPNIGMYNQACALYPEIDSTTALFIGDSDSDMLFAQRANIDFIRV